VRCPTFALVALCACTEAGHDFELRVTVATMTDDVGVYVDDAPRTPTTVDGWMRTETVVRHDSYAEALDAEDIDPRIDRSDETLFDERLKAGICASEGSAWYFESRVFVVRMDPRGALVAGDGGYLCEDGERGVAGAP